MLRLENVSKIYPTGEVLRAVTWEVKPGDRIGLVGVNGAGKSTMINSIASHSNSDIGTVANFVPGISKGETYSSAYLLDEQQFLYRNKVKKNHSRREGDIGRFLWECIEKGCHASILTELKEGDTEVERLVGKGKFAHSHTSDPGKVGVLDLDSSRSECLFSGSSAESSCWGTNQGSLHQAS